VRATNRRVLAAGLQIVSKTLLMFRLRRFTVSLSSSIEQPMWDQAVDPRRAVRGVAVHSLVYHGRSPSD
jgi:hypothetical protein